MLLRELIKAKTAEHLNNGGLICCQNLTGVGALNDTFPSEFNDHPGVIELPTSDSSNSAVAVGMSLFKRCVYVIRFAGFLWYNAATIVNYAAKSKELWGVDCPLFVRVMSTEGSIGPVASGAHHSMIVHTPGITVISPMTPNEWKEAWDFYMSQSGPVLCSEHRRGFNVDYEMPDVMVDNPKVTLFALSAARLNALEIKDCDLFHVVWLKPFKVNELAYESLKKTGIGLVVDSDYPVCGMAEHIAYQLMLKTGAKVYTMGLEDRTAGFAPHCDNLTPSTERIREFIVQSMK